MLPDEFELFLRSEIATNRTLDWLMDRIFNDDDPEEAREALKRIANQFPEELPQSLDALIYYRGMRAALNEDDFLWGALCSLPPAQRKKERKRRLEQYNRNLDLFELEMKLARAVQRSGMALRGNWKMDEYFADSVFLTRQRMLLRMAGVFYRHHIPGAMDLCDRAVFEMFRVLYLRPSPAA